MAKLILSMFMSLDGYVEGPNGAFIGPAWSADMETHWANANTARAARLLYGRTNFLFNRDFWLDPNGPAAAAPHAKLMNALPKTVVSTTLSGDVGWNGTVVRDLSAVAALKADTDGDIQSFGGAGLADGLIRAGLIDEYVLLIMPTLFGGGRRLFRDDRAPADLALIDSRQFDTGAVLLRYQPAA
ncbi:MAG TPA: dihydrofolate reductase family protein [Caulobacteraceae bacterium]|nr:dihydrofolate reductase family protein [Caulobacteraceae bacterium]